MDFSLYFFAASTAGTPQKKPYDLLLRGAKYADENDFHAVWFPERHFTPFGDIFPNPSVCAAAVAAITERVRIRPGSVVLPLHDVIRVAEEWSVVDNLSDGRVDISIASGWHPNDFVLAPENYSERQAVMVDGVKSLRSLWRGVPIERRNGLGKTCSVSIFPKPVQSELPVWITAATSPDTYRYAGSIGAKLLTNLLLQPITELREKIDIYREALVAAGFSADDGKIAIMVHTFMSENEDEARRHVELPFKNYLKEFANLLRPVAEQSGLDFKRAENLMIEMGFKRYYRSSGLFGSVSNCLERVEELISYGVNEIACLIDFGIEREVTLEHLDNLRRLKNTVSQKRV